MVDLARHDPDREAWIRWAREFVHRGWWPTGIITVHGPLESPADCWGSAECTPESDPASIWEVKFQSRRSNIGKCKYPMRNVVMRVDSPLGEQLCPVLKMSELSMRARRWLGAAHRTLADYERKRRKKRQDNMGRNHQPKSGKRKAE